MGDLCSVDKRKFVISTVWEICVLLINGSLLYQLRQFTFSPNSPTIKMLFIVSN